MSDTRSTSILPWQVTRQEFVRAAAEIEEGGACCMFIIDDTIPSTARSGYAALVIAYARADEPVCIFDDGASVILVRSGGTKSGEVVAARILTQMQRLSLERTLRAGVVDLGHDPEAAIEAARAAAEGAAPGSVTVKP